MKLLIEKTNNKVSNIVKLEMLSTEFNSVTKLIKENEIPVVVFTDTNESYLINNINELINNARNNTEVYLDIVLDNLISLGGSGGDSRPYKVYTALLTQLGTDAPVATVLENTLGEEVVWTRFDVGSYETNITFTEMTSIDVNQNKPNNVIESYIDNDDYGGSLKAQVITRTKTELVTPVDNVLLYTLVEIRVYN